MSTAAIGADIDPHILREAVDWLVILQSGDATDRDRERLARWRGRSAAHEAAWRRAEDVLETFQRVPPQLGRGTLGRLGNSSRRQVLRSLAFLAVAAPAAWLGWRRFGPGAGRLQLATARGEQRSTTLPDDTRLVLNTATRVEVVFSAQERRLELMEGEILITTGADAGHAPRPLVVHTPEGRLRPIGTRFAVRRTDNRTQVTVTEGAVEVRTAAASEALIVRAGEQTSFSARHIQAIQGADAGALLWERGMLLARDMRLAALLVELGRYHHASLRCDPAVADVRVSGAFPVTDVEASLALLEKTLPLRLRRDAGTVTVLAR